MNVNGDSTAGRFAPIAILLVAVFLLTYQTLGMRAIEGLDAAHTIMDGFFFRDLMTDLPMNPAAYTLDYYRQYPALGFLFWPPLFPFVLGIAFFIGGLDIRLAHWCLMGFGWLLAVMTYLIARRKLSRTMSVLAALVIVTTPIVGRQFNILMREVPALAMAMATFYLYLRFVETPSWKRSVGLAVVGAAALYTKQTILFIYPVLAIDALWNRRHLLRDKRLWTAVGLMAVLAAPLVLFTLTVAKVNLDQSLGSDPKLNMLGVDRWNLVAWTYYPLALFRILNPVILVLCALALLYAIRSRQFLRENVLWVSWIVVWLAVFSWILAKETRHTLLWTPGWCMLAVLYLNELRSRAPR
jgi:4-amino-4-deoxy-L-arabinose transferase-like glycosyltransferase